MKWYTYLIARLEEKSLRNSWWTEESPNLLSECMVPQLSLNVQVLRIPILESAVTEHTIHKHLTMLSKYWWNQLCLAQWEGRSQADPRIGSRTQGFLQTCSKWPQKSVLQAHDSYSYINIQIWIYLLDRLYPEKASLDLRFSINH